MTLYTPIEVARMLKISRTKVYELVASGELIPTRIGGSIRIIHEDLASYVSSCRVVKRKRKASSSPSKLRYLRVS